MFEPKLELELELEWRSEVGGRRGEGINLLPARETARLQKRQRETERQRERERACLCPRGTQSEAKLR